MSTPTSALDRRRFLTTVAALGGTAMLAGCDRFAGSVYGPRTLKAGEDANLFVQRLLLSNASLAREFPDAEISAVFKPNGTIDPPDKAYKALAAANFDTFKLEIGGLVERPQSLGLSDLRGMPSRTQTTRHDCVEGWSCIGKWSGVRLSHLLDLAGVKDAARYAVFHCADTPAEPSFGDEPAHFYGSIDLAAARHEQTILAYDLNGAPLDVAHGAPLRLRVERQLGYKMSKYVMRVELVESFAHLGDGRGGYWEDNGYNWYAGI